MTDTVIAIPDYVTRARSLTDLAVAAAGLLEAAEDSGLTLPRSLRLAHIAQYISLGFRDDPGTFEALARWAERFGSTVTAKPYIADDGDESVLTEVRFTYVGLAVEAYAFITAGEASTG